MPSDIGMVEGIRDWQSILQTAWRAAFPGAATFARGVGMFLILSCVDAVSNRRAENAGR